MIADIPLVRERERARERKKRTELKEVKNTSNGTKEVNVCEARFSRRCCENCYDLRVR